MEREIEKIVEKSLCDYCLKKCHLLRTAPICLTESKDICDERNLKITEVQSLISQREKEAVITERERIIDVFVKHYNITRANVQREWIENMVGKSKS